MLALGDVRFGRLSETVERDQDLPAYRAFADAGLIDITNERDLTAAFTGWDDFFVLTQAGVRRTAIVTLTADGKASSFVQPMEASMSIDGPTRPMAKVTIGRYDVRDIVENELLQITADQCHVLPRCLRDRRQQEQRARLGEGVGGIRRPMEE